jgi:hypothetical protein
VRGRGNKDQHEAFHGFAVCISLILGSTLQSYPWYIAVLVGSFNISRVLVVPKLKVADLYVDWPILKRRWNHLHALDIPAVDTNQVGYFIGTNVPKALLQLENRTLSEKDPVGILMPFGWSVIGEIPATCMGERLEN